MNARRQFSRRFICAGLLATASASASAQNMTSMDPRNILFSMPTLADDMAALDPVERGPSDEDLVFHEDEWRQLEFYSSGRLGEIQGKLRELAAFEAAHRVQSGWTQVYVRQLRAAPVLAGPDALNSLSRGLGAQVQQSPVLFHGTHSITGRIHSGFSLQLGQRAWLYGFQDGTGIPVLGAMLQDADDQLLTSAFSRLYHSDRLVLVDWRAQMVLTGVTASGQIDVWSPRQS